MLPLPSWARRLFSTGWDDTAIDYAPSASALNAAHIAKQFVIPKGFHAVIYADRADIHPMGSHPDCSCSRPKS